MNIMPISSYPMPSDANSQIDVLEESKSDISQQSQDIEQSKLGNSQKQELTDKLQGKENNITSDIRHKEVDEDYNKKLNSKKVEQQSFDDSDIKKQAKPKTGLDVRA